MFAPALACEPGSGTSTVQAPPLLRPSLESRLSHPALADALDRAQFGIIVAGSGGSVVFANAYARQILERGDGLVVGQAGLEARDAATTRRLRELIAQSLSGQLAGCATLQLPRERRLRPLILHFAANGYARAASGCVTVYLCDPHHQPAVDPATLSRLFGFTRAESALALLLMRGTSVEEAAATLFVSQHTVRTHLKRMLLKTDTGRQAELLRLLLTCSAQVRLD